MESSVNNRTSLYRLQLLLHRDIILSLAELRQER
ncbi:hypothetical protein J2T55_001856 [Methylohalomonas lacus]|uniref:Uncharacterized protein n=1 Tax=Methylohalomonas lacus TaxID=398773 RepID=A0AAE3HMF5_9GAMM|nr:hypothetical protein [Methylohalomonas lacus]